MTRRFVMLLSLSALLALATAVHAGQAGAAASIKLSKADLVAEVKTDQREMIVPAAGQRFLWIKADASKAQTIDLNKVTVASGASTFALIGVDAMFDGDPSQFSMIAPFRTKAGEARDPLEETKSVGWIKYAFTPKTKTATVTVVTPPQSFCLLFSVPATFKTGQVKSLGATDLAVPALGAAK